MLRLLLALFLLIPMPVLADHVPTQPAYGQDLTTDNTAGTITIGILGSDGFEDSPPENYTIFFSGSSGITETNSFCVTTSFGHQTNTWQYYTFSNDDLKYYFADLAGENFYFAIRSNNETDNSVSTLTTESVYNIYAGPPFEFNQTDWSAPTGTDACNPYVVTTTTTTTTTTTIPPAVPDDATNVSVNYQGKDVYFAWEYTDGNTLVNEFHINYSYDNSIWDRVVITDTTARTYTLDYTNIQTGTFYWTFSVCGDIENGESCTDSDSNNFETTEYVPPTTTTLPPPPPPPPPEPEKVEVVMEDGSTAEYETYEVEDGTVDRDNQRKANEDKYGCYMTDAQIERGDCDIVEDNEEPKPDTETELPDDDVVVLEVEPKDEVEDIEPIKEEDIVKEEIKINVKELEEEFDFEEIIVEIPDEVIIIVEENIVEEDIVVIIVEEELNEEVKKITEEVLVEPVQEDVKKDIVELTEEEVAIEVAEVEKVIEDIVIEKVTTEKVIEVIEQVNDIGVQNLDQATEEVQKVVQAVVEEAIKNVENLSEEQVAVVAEVLQVEENDVEIIAEAVKEDKVVAEAVEEYVERAVKNADVENYTLADVVTEVQYENFLENPIKTFVDLDFEGITLSNIGDDMTNDQKEKAQEVVVPVILTRIATMAAFVFRRSL
jgi:hypothetical protein